jgi:membrane-associated phospholipid phosphatase
VSSAQRVHPRSSSSRVSARVALAAASLALVAIPFALIVLLVQARWAPLLEVDNGARDGLHHYAVGHAGFVTAMQLISHSGSGVAWLAVLTPVVGWLLWRRLPRLALFVAITAIGSSLLNSLVKATVDRQRPVLANPVARERTLSFPSGHAQAAMVGFAVLLIVFLPIARGAWRRTAVTTAVLAVIAIGFSRVALGVHYLSDVLGGFVLGAAWVAAMSAAFDVFGADHE